MALDGAMIIFLVLFNSKQIQALLKNRKKYDIQKFLPLILLELHIYFN